MTVIFRLLLWKRHLLQSIGQMTRSRSMEGLSTHSSGRLPSAGPLAAEGLQAVLSFDASVHIRRAIGLVNANLVMGVFLALGVLWWFLRGWRATLMIATTIPFSIPKVEYVTIKRTVWQLPAGLAHCPWRKSDMMHVVFAWYWNRINCL